VHVVNTPLPVQVTNPTPPAPSTVNIGNPDAIATAILHQQTPAMNSFLASDAFNSGAPLPMTPTVPAGKLFVVTYIAMNMGPNNAAFPVTSSACFLFAPVGPGSISIIRTIPGTVVLGGWSASETSFFVLNAGEALGISCSYTAGGATAFLQGVVGGYFQPAQ